MSPTPRAAALTAAPALLALALPPWIPALAVASLLAVTTADAARARRDPALERELPSVVARGTPAGFVVRASARSGAVRLRQPNSPALWFDPQEGDSAIHGTLTPKLRGRHHAPAPAAVVTGPLGLGRWYYRESGRAQEVVVYPDLPGARRIAQSVRRGRFGDPGHFTRGPLGLGTDFESIREYVPDDDFRQVNWRATARVGRPMTNQYRVEQDRDVVCVVDAGRLMGAQVATDSTRLDVAIDAATAVALVADEVGDRCGTIAFDAAIRREIRPRRAGADRVVAALFDVEPSETDSDYELAFRSVGGGKRSLVLVLTDLVDLAAARSLVAATPVLARRHFVVVAGTADAELEVLASSPPIGLAEAARRTVAHNVLATRSEVAARLRRAGAAVVDAPPERLPAACVAAYLRAKVRARL